MVNLVRAYHPNEVVSIDELKAGSKIRCHYAAAKRCFGDFSGLGSQTSGFITTEKTIDPQGDFYFICVSKDENEIILIADRVIQTYISARTILDVVGEKGKEIYFSDSEPKGRYYIDLLTGGTSYDDKNNDWDTLVLNSVNNFPSLLSKQDWFIEGPFATWTKSKPIEIADYQKYQIIRGIGFYTVSIIGDSPEHITYGSSDVENQANGFRPKLTIML